MRSVPCYPQRLQLCVWDGLKVYSEKEIGPIFWMSRRLLARLQKPQQTIYMVRVGFTTNRSRSRAFSLSLKVTTGGFSSLVKREAALALSRD